MSACGAPQRDQRHETLRELIRAPKSADCGAIVLAAQDILHDVDAEKFDQYTETLSRACFALFEIGKSQQGIDLGIKIANAAQALARTAIQRRIYNILGAQYGDILDFASSMKYLEMAIVLARQLDDPAAEIACLANVVAVLQEMGHYRHAISMASRTLGSPYSSPLINNLKLQCASNGLFAAHRIGDARAAAAFLNQGEGFLERDVEILRRAFFERSRALYLIDSGNPSLAYQYVKATADIAGSAPSERITCLLAISEALCQWGCGDKQVARRRLTELYGQTAASRLYHHFVLQALVKVHGDAETQAEVEAGLAYARELVEFTTSVKKAKFYRQLQSRKAALPTAGVATSQNVPSLAVTDIDPFGLSKDWLTATNVECASDEGAIQTKRELAKHEELTVIHEDMARLRVASLRQEIRTDAVDTAENWAIAAEFFDDETGKHCYRVGHLASMLAREVGMDETFCVQIEHAARLHDIGKIAVNEVILLKPGPLDAAEMAAMRLHTEVGAQILAGSEDPTLRMAVEVARHHHEWWNGNGYPRKLSGRNIPLAARISAFADVYDALTHVRAYKSAWTHERAVEEIERLSGTQFDPDLLAPFQKVLVRYLSDLRAELIPGFMDMDSNALIASRRRLMDTISSP